MTPPSPATVIDRVDEADRPVGVIARHEALAVGANFRTAHVFLFDDAGRLLLQRLAEARSRHPGRWGSSVAAYVSRGETYAAAAARRLHEELGLDVVLERFGKLRTRDQRSTKFVTLFVGRSGPAKILEPDHIAELAYRSLEELDSLTARRPGQFTPTFLELYALYRARR